MYKHDGFIGGTGKEIDKGVKRVREEHGGGRRVKRKVATSPDTDRHVVGSGAGKKGCADRVILRGRIFYGSPSRTDRGKIIHGLPSAREYHASFMTQYR